MRHELSDDAIQEIQAELFAGRTFPAIKAYRRASGAPLADAVAFIDALDKRLREQSPERFTAPPRRSGGCVLMAACLAAMLIALVMALALLRL
jgi:hypothetical protein